MTLTSERLSFTDAAYSIASLLDTAVLPSLPKDASGFGAWLSVALEKHRLLSRGEMVLLDVAWSLYSNRREAALLDLWALDADLRHAVFDTLGRIR